MMDGNRERSLLDQSNLLTGIFIYLFISKTLWAESKLRLNGFLANNLWASMDTGKRGLCHYAYFNSCYFVDLM